MSVSVNSNKTNVKLNNSSERNSFANTVVLPMTTSLALSSTCKNQFDKVFIKLIKKTALPDKETESLQGAIKKTLETSGLNKKGVKLLRTDEFLSFETLNNKKALEELRDAIKNGKGYKFLSRLFPDKYKQALDNGFDIAIKTRLIECIEGVNAFFCKQKNLIVAPEKSLQGIIFHEMGHALNANGNLKALGKLYPLGRVLPVVTLLSSLILNRKKDDKKVSSDNKKADLKKTFVKHAPKIAFLSCLPILLEEAIASLRGQKMANELIKKGELAKKLGRNVAKCNALGFSTYLAFAASGALGVKLALAMQNRIQGTKKDAETACDKMSAMKLKAHQG